MTVFRFVFKWLMVASLALLSACMPELNWREVAPDQAGFVLLMPTKPDRMSRPIDLNGLKVTMHMMGSQREPVAYTVAWVDTATPEEARQAAQAMRIGMLRNLGQADQPGKPAQVLIRGGATHWPAVQIEVSAGGKQMRGLFLNRGRRAWQVVSVGPTLDAEASKIFAESFQLLPE